MVNDVVESEELETVLLLFRVQLVLHAVQGGVAVLLDLGDDALILLRVPLI